MNLEAGFNFLEYYYQDKPPGSRVESAGHSPCFDELLHLDQHCHWHLRRQAQVSHLVGSRDWSTARSTYTLYSNTIYIYIYFSIYMHIQMHTYIYIYINL